MARARIFAMFAISHSVFPRSKKNIKPNIIHLVHTLNFPKNVRVHIRGKEMLFFFGKLSVRTKSIIPLDN